MSMKTEAAMLSQQAFMAGMLQLDRIFNCSGKLDRDSLRLYYDAVSDLTAGQYSSAIKICIRSCENFPVPAEIREHAHVQAGESNSRVSETEQSVRTL